MMSACMQPTVVIMFFCLLLCNGVMLIVLCVCAFVGALVGRTLEAFLTMKMASERFATIDFFF